MPSPLRVPARRLRRAAAAWAPVVAGCAAVLALTATPAAAAPVPAELAVGAAVSSENGRFQLHLQGDGNLVLYATGGPARWASDTSGAGHRLAVQGDGNVVIYGGDGAPVWHTSTYGEPGARLEVQSDGNLVVYSATGGPLWDAAGHTGRAAVHLLPPFAATVTGVTAAELGASWAPGCPVAPAELRRVAVTHVGLGGGARVGELIVHADAVAAVQSVFGSLYDARFPVERMRPTAEFGGSDDASMAAGNTSGFTCRRVTGGTSWSEHSYGRAVDLNPVQNPYVAGATVLPPAGVAYLDRTRARPGMVLAGDVAVRAFAAVGWRWGGDYRTVKDYQHFSTTGR